ncbi:MAG TPA: acyloxyacyl hydrolase [Bacteroidales bacterium]|nr:acyloxyacyl hydrolase [Bacteroidales bacterium]
MKTPDGMRILLTATLLLLFHTVTLRAQENVTLYSPNLMFEAKVHYGFFYAHHLELYQYNGHFPAFEVNVQKITYGKHKWQRDFNYPGYGIVLYYCGLGNNPSLGQAFAIMPTINFPLIKTRTFSLGFRFSLGVGYLTKRFDRIDNYKNLAIGSHINAAVNLMAEARFRINPSFSVSTGVSLQHFSNGSLKLPNNGINTPLVNVGVAYQPFKENKKITDRFYPPVDPYSAILQQILDFNFGFSLGWKNQKAVTGESFLVYHLWENTLVKLSRKSQLGIGFDLSYDPSQKTVYQLYYMDLNGKEDTTVTNWKFIYPGINAVYNLTLGKVGILLNFGYYLHVMKPTKSIYQKISVQYNFSKHWFANLMLKVVWGKAEYIGYGMGYRFEVRFGRKTVK